MRRRVLLAGLALAATVTLLVGAPAGAQDSGSTQGGAAKKLTKVQEDCIKLLESGKNPTDCNEAPSPILPETNELVWGAISFAAILFLLWKFAWPGLKKGMDARSDRIRADLSKAESAKDEADGVLTEYRAQLADARSEASRIIEESRQTADALRRDLQTQAQADIADLRQKAAADIEVAKAQAIADLRGEVTALAIGAAERVVERNLDEATNAQLVESYIAQVGASS